MAQYVNLVKQLSQDFKEMKIEQIPRSENAIADAMVNLGATVEEKDINGLIIYVMLQESALKSLERAVAVIERGDWREPIRSYLKTGTFPLDKEKARRIRIQSARFCMI